MVNANELFLSGRMDPEFHLMKKSHEKSIEALQEEMTAEDAGSLSLAAINDFPHLSRELTMLTTGQGRVDKESIFKAINTHPYLALAIIQKALPKVESSLNKEREHLDHKENVLKELKIKLDSRKGEPVTSRKNKP